MLLIPHLRKAAKRWRQLFFGHMGQMTFKTLGLLFIAMFGTTYGQSQSTIDNQKISTDKELNFATTDKRGIKADDGIIFLVLEDGQTLISYHKGKIIWTVNVVKTCELPDAGVQGKQDVRHIKLSVDKICVTYGKHEYANVDIKDGKVKCLGSD